MKDTTSKIGKNFGRWTVLSFAEHRGHNAYWNCRCQCGVEKIIAGYSLTNNNSKSCGCWKKEQSCLPVGEASMKAVYRQYQRIAKERSLGFDLSLQQFRGITSSDCHYCGGIPAQTLNHHNSPYNGNYIYNGIDRVNNTLGYSVTNCVPCCGACNIAKHNMTQEQFYVWLERTYLYSLGVPRAKPITQLIQETICQQADTTSKD